MPESEAWKEYEKLQHQLVSVEEGPTFRAPLSDTFLQTLPELVTPLKGHSLSPRNCPPTRSAPSQRFGTNKTVEET